MAELSESERAQFKAKIVARLGLIDLDRATMQEVAERLEKNERVLSTLLGEQLRNLIAQALCELFAEELGMYAPKRTDIVLL